MYKITIYERKNYPNGGQVLLDTSSGTNPGVMTAKCECTLNEAGSCTFGLAQIHPLYDSIKPLQTYVSVEDEGDEIFFGRVILVQKNKLTGQKTVTCEGALAFLMDIEMDADSSETTYTAQNYFIHCLSVFNSQIANDGIYNADPARRLEAGTVNIAKKNENGKYKNGSRTQVQSVMKSRLLGNYDGFFNVHRSGTAHYLDWVTQVGTTNPQRIKITENVTSHSATESGEDMFTKVWPKGNNDVQLSPITVNGDMLRDCGVIIKTVNFDADSTSELQSKVNDYISKLQDRLSLNGEIGFVDFHYLDGTIPKVKLGDVFTGIDGYEGTKFTAAKISRDLLNPATDKLSLKTDKDLMTTAGSNGANSKSSGSGATSGSGGKRGVSGVGAHMYKYIHEGIDSLSLATKQISISAAEKFSLIGQEIQIIGGNISSLSADLQTTSSAVSGLKGEWQTYKGTAIYQNRDQIAQVAGKFSVNNSGDVLLEDGAEFVITQNGTSTNVGQLTRNLDQRVDGLGDWVTEYEGSYTYQNDEAIGGLVGLYTIKKYVDPEYHEYAVPSGANPKALGLYEKDNQNNYVKTNDTTVVAGKKYYHLEDIEEVTFHSGGGYKIERDGVEYGIYDDGTLTGGVIVNKLNDGTTTTKIKGSRVIIGEALTDEDLGTWAQEAANGTGVFAKFLTVRTLTAQEIQTVLANIGTANIGSVLATSLELSNGGVGGGLSCGQVDCGQIDCTGFTTNSGDGYVGGTLDCENLTIGEQAVNVLDATVSGNTLTITRVTGGPITFSKATTITGAWSSGTLTVQTDLASILPYVRTLAAGSWEDLDGSPYSGGSEWRIPISAQWGSSGQYSDDTGWKVYVNASDLVATSVVAGKNAVTLNDPTWNAITGETPDHRTVTVTTNGRPTQLSKSVDLYLTQGSSWSSNKKTVAMRTVSTSGVVYAQTEVDASTLVADAETSGYNSAKIVKGTWSSGSVSLTKSSSSGSSSQSINLNLANTTWNGTVASTQIYDGTIGASGTQYTGKTVSVDVSGKLQSKSVTSNGTVSPDSGYIGLSSVTVDVPTGSITWPNSIASTSYTAEGGHASASFTANGETRSYFINRTTFVNSGGTTLNCIEIKYGNAVVARESIQKFATDHWNAGYSSGYTAGKDDLTWSWSSAASTSNTEPTGNFAKNYGVSKGYSWAWFTVTVNGHSYRFKIHMMS